MPPHKTQNVPKIKQAKNPLQNVIASNIRDTNQRSTENKCRYQALHHPLRTKFKK